MLCSRSAGLCNCVRLSLDVGAYRPGRFDFRSPMTDHGRQPCTKGRHFLSSLAKLIPLRQHFVAVSFEVVACLNSHLRYDCLPRLVKF